MPMYCPDGECAGIEYDDYEYQCRVHERELVPFRPDTAAPPTDAGPADTTAPGDGTDRSAGPDSGRPWNADQCWSCQAQSPNRENGNCVRCLESLVPPRLVLTWDTGSIRLRPGESVRLGRRKPYEHLFDGHGNVSREHADVGVDADGTAWIEPVETAGNGTFRPGTPDVELFHGSRHELRDGQPLRFARDVMIDVAVFALPNR